MNDPLLIRRGKGDKLIANENLMSPGELLVNKRILQLSDVVSCTFEVSQGRGNADIFSEALLCLDAISNDPIKLIISCSGGSVHGVFSLYDTIKAIDSPVWTFGKVCMSGGALLLAAGEKGHRYVYPNSFSMLHLLQISSRSGITDSRTDAIRSAEFTRQKDRMIELLIECGVNKTHDKINEDIDRELWMDAKETVTYGLADHIIRGGVLLE
jgi:ATP-dependent Clp protease protease subunit